MNVCNYIGELCWGVAFNCYNFLKNLSQLDNNVSNESIQLVYDCTNHIVQFHYNLGGDKHFILCVPEDSKISELYTKLQYMIDNNNKKQLIDYSFIDVILNDSIDITGKFNSFMGPNDLHLKYLKKIPLSYILDIYETEIFENLKTMNKNFISSNYSSIHDVIQIQDEKKKIVR